VTKKKRTSSPAEALNRRYKGSPNFNRKKKENYLFFEKKTNLCPRNKKKRIKRKLKRNFVSQKNGRKGRENVDVIKKRTKGEIGGKKEMKIGT